MLWFLDSRDISPPCGLGCVGGLHAPPPPPLDTSGDWRSETMDTNGVCHSEAMDTNGVWRSEAMGTNAVWRPEAMDTNGAWHSETTFPHNFVQVRKIFYKSVKYRTLPFANPALPLAGRVATIKSFSRLATPSTTNPTTSRANILARETKSIVSSTYA